MTGKSAVLMMAYGSPSSIDDMRAYLLDIRDGRPPSDDLVAEMQHRYRSVGGSPLERITMAQARALDAALAQRGRSMRVYVGMRHWAPRIRDAVARMTADGVTDAVSIVMAPHGSTLSADKYRLRVEEAAASTASRIRFRHVREWWRQPRLLDAWADLVREGLNRPGSGNEGETMLVFSAHSLPARIRSAGDSYEGQLRAHAAAIAERVDCRNWDFAFQSAGASPEPWLGPPLEEVLPGLASRGFRRALVAPIGFVCEHVEILFDLDVEARAQAASLGMTLERTGLPNDSPQFIHAVADAVLSSMQAGVGEP